MNIKDVIKIKPELRDAMVGAFVIECLQRVSIPPDGAEARLLDLNPHLSIQHQCDAVISAAWQELTQKIDREFVMSVWLTSLYLDNLKLQLHFAQQKRPVGVLKLFKLLHQDVPIKFFHKGASKV